jgi:hypothetical protein
MESDVVPGVFYPCHECNPNWSRVPEPRGRDDMEWCDAQNNLRWIEPERRNVVRGWINKDRADMRAAIRDRYASRIEPSSTQGVKNG